MSDLQKSLQTSWLKHIDRILTFINSPLDPNSLEYQLERAKIMAESSFLTQEHDKILNNRGK